MHPVHRLLDPHFKGTMHVNSIARAILISSAGVFEKTLFTGEVSMELSSALYKEWRFNEQCLPADLLKRYALQQQFYFLVHYYHFLVHLDFTSTLSRQI